MLNALWNDFINKNEQSKSLVPMVASILKQTRLIEIKDGSVLLACPNQGSRIYILRKLTLIERLFSAHIGKKTKVETVIQLVPPKKRTVATSPPLLNFQPTVEDILSRSGLSQKYQMENFAVSPTNQVAYAAAQAVIERPGTAYNPLFIHGGVGVGKTHLAQAVAHSIINIDPNKKVYFCPGDQFTNELIDSIRGKTTEKFRKKYRHLSLLIVDDVQFIAGKTGIQEEFFHTFNSVVSVGGQVILTSDRPPQEIKNLEDRLRSRFGGGLVLDIQPPDFELRCAIVLIKAKEKNVEINIEAARLIAERVIDARSLEGALISVYAKIIGKKEIIDLEAVESYFSQQTDRVTKKTEFPEVIRAVCSFYNIKSSQIRGPLREEKIATARQVAMFILRTVLKINLIEVAHILKRRDHTTVIHGVKKIQRLTMLNPIFKQEVDRIIQSVVSST